MAAVNGAVLLLFVLLAIAVVALIRDWYHRNVDYHVSRALSSRERVRKSLDMAAGEDR